MRCRRSATVLASFAEAVGVAPSRRAIESFAPLCPVHLNRQTVHVGGELCFQQGGGRPTGWRRHALHPWSMVFNPFSPRANKPADRS